MTIARSTKTLAALTIAALAAAVLGGRLSSEEAAVIKRHSARWHVHIFKEAAQGKEFDEFLGGEFRYRDSQGKPIAIGGIPGKVAKLAAESVTLNLNDGGAPREFPIKADAEDARDVAAQLRRLDIGSRAMVITVNGEARYAVDLAGRDQEKPPGE